jgi:hypothetical protein
VQDSSPPACCHNQLLSFLYLIFASFSLGVLIHSRLTVDMGRTSFLCLTGHTFGTPFRLLTCKFAKIITEKIFYQSFIFQRYALLSQKILFQDSRS